MSNYHLRDKNLSLKAKGLLSMMLSLPDEWHYSVRGLAGICKEGVSSISATIRELDACGYIRRHQPIVDGKFQEIEYLHIFSALSTHAILLAFAVSPHSNLELVSYRTDGLKS